MRFLAVQDDRYGIGLGQDELPDNVEHSIMATTGGLEPVGTDVADESSTVYNLPLLFANGFPTSLDKISLRQLERFIIFMVQCSSSQQTTGVISKPPWWPQEIQFTLPLVRPPKLGDNWIKSLKKLVLTCYTFHKSEYLLRFCAYLAQYPRDKIYYVNNWDTTTSLYHKSTGKLLATFRNENMEYDKTAETSRRTLLQQNNVKARSSTKRKKSQEKTIKKTSPVIIVQPETEEIYLCDNCDAEFGYLQQMKEHEKTCTEPTPIANVSRSATPCEIAEPVTTQKQFLQYFQLNTIDEPTKPPPVISSAITIEQEPSRSTRRHRTIPNLARCPTIPFSSPAGLAMAKKSKGMTEVTQLERLDRLERHVSAPPLKKMNRPKWLDRVPQYSRWTVTYKPNKETTASDNYVHQYTFGARKRKLVLSLRSQILYVACGYCYVRMERLNDEQINELKLHPFQYQAPVRKITPRNRRRTRNKIKQAPEAGHNIDPMTCPVEEIIIEEDCASEKTPHFRSRLLENVDNASRTENQSKDIVYIDLCSSDEEEEIQKPILADENQDPLAMTSNGTWNNNTKGPGIQSIKIRTNGSTVSETTGNDCLRENVLTVENDSFINIRRLNNGVLDTRSIAYLPIIKPPYE